MLIYDVIARHFRKFFHGHSNIMTPYIADFRQYGGFIVEYSWGYGFDNKKIYAATVLQLINGVAVRPVGVQSKGGFSSMEEAEEYIKTAIKGVL